MRGGSNFDFWCRQRASHLAQGFELVLTSDAFKPQQRTLESV
jgi:hypothetical protein